MVDEASKCFFVCVAVQFDFVCDFGRYCRGAHEVSSDSHDNLIQLDATSERFAEKVVRYAAGNREVHELTIVEAAAAATCLRRSIHHQRELTSASQCRDLACEISRFNL